MKVVTLLLTVALLASLGFNAFLWRQISRQRVEAEALRAGAAKIEAVLAENEALKNQLAARPAATDAATLELARLRNEVGQLRRQAAESDTLRMSELAQLRARLAATQKELAATEGSLAETAKLTPEESLSLKQEAQATQCVNNLKQIGLAARLWASDHNNVFPPDLATMKNELATPKILFCPAAPGGVEATTWEELNPATISYQFLNPNGNESDPQKPLTFCPLHNTIVLSDGSVHRDRKP
jgi:hypothetical protein